MDVGLTAHNWAEEQFSGCELGDKRRTKRLIRMATAMCLRIGKSLSHCCQGDDAALEGGYRFIRNQSITPAAIAEGIFKATHKKAQGRSRLLALEDTTTLSYRHEVEDLGDIGGPSGSKSKGFHAHSVLLVDDQTNETLGLIAQTRWKRTSKERGRSHQRHSRAYEEKESFKWEKSSEKLEGRMRDGMSNVISICDREADIYEYLDYKLRKEQRFVVRASQDRRLYEGVDERMLDALDSSCELGRYSINILQKSGRKSRTAELSLKSCSVEIVPPKRLSRTEASLEFNVVIATEVNTAENEKPLTWVLLTSEPVKEFVEARQVVSCYEKRWRIEEFHKAWKSGAGVEQQRMQSPDNLERMAVVLSAVAVRLLQLKEGLEKDVSENTESLSCRSVLSEEEFIVLWFATQGKKIKKKSVPKEIPNLPWAYRAIAKLGGWSDSKRIGRASWATIWDGWFCLQERLEGYRVAKEMVEM